MLQAKCEKVTKERQVQTLELWRSSARIRQLTEAHEFLNRKLVKETGEVSVMKRELSL